MDRKKIGLMLQGMGAGFQGRLPEFQRGQLLQQAQEQALTEERKQAMLEDAYRVQQALQSGFPPAALDILYDRFDEIRARGGDPSDTLQLIKKIEARDPSAMVDVSTLVDYGFASGRLQNPAMTLPAGIREFNTMAQDLTPEEVVQARRINLGLDPRAVGSAAQTITGAGTAPAVAETLGTLEAGKEGGKLAAQRELKPEVESAVRTAVETATRLAKYASTAKSNAATFAVYETGMAELARAMGATTTGPGMGYLPALTANAQIADGAVAAMAPILKQLFRAAGEGIFTDKDQELLLAMVPSRNDLPAAARAKLSNIDAIVRAKLQMYPGAGGMTLPAGFNELTDQEQKELIMLMGQRNE